MKLAKHHECTRLGQHLHYHDPQAGWTCILQSTQLQADRNVEVTVALCDNKAALADSCLQSFSDLLTGQIGAVLAYMPPKL